MLDRMCCFHRPRTKEQEPLIPSSLKNGPPKLGWSVAEYSGDFSKDSGSHFLTSTTSENSTCAKDGESRFKGRSTLLGKHVFERTTEEKSISRKTKVHSGKVFHKCKTNSCQLCRSFLPNERVTKNVLQSNQSEKMLKRMGGKLTSTSPLDLFDKDRIITVNGQSCWCGHSSSPEKCSQCKDHLISLYENNNNTQTQTQCRANGTEIACVDVSEELHVYCSAKTSLSQSKLSAAQSSVKEHPGTSHCRWVLPEKNSCNKKLESLIRKVVVKAEDVSRPLNCWLGKLRVPHAGVLLTTADGERWLVHKARSNGRMDTAVTSADDMKSTWRVRATKTVSWLTLGDFVKASGSDYNVITNNCWHSRRRMMELCD